jgi:hypothetical protein
MATSKITKHRNDQIELLAAAGETVDAIGRKFGISSITVRRHLNKPGAILRVEEHKKEIKQRIMHEAAALGEKFDEEAPHAFNTLRALNRGETHDVDNPVPHSTRLAAAREVLDRSPSSPRPAAKEEGDRVLVINLPEKTVGNMQQALKDVGEVIDVETEPKD